MPSPDRTLPHDLQAEKSLLGAILVDPTAIDRVVNLPEDAFYRKAHRLIFRGLLDLQKAGTSIDAITLKNTLDKAGALDDCGGMAYLSTLDDGMPLRANVEGWAKVIRDKAQLRHVIRYTTDALSAAYDGDMGDSVAAIRQAIVDVPTPAASEEYRVIDEMQRERARREARRRLDAEALPVHELDIGILRERLTRPTPVRRERIEGWQSIGSRVLLAAQFKAGKTTLRDNLIASLVDGTPFLGRYAVAPITGVVAVVDSEMSGWQLDDWFRKHAIQNDDRVLIIPCRGAVSAFNLLHQETRAQWADLLRGFNVEYLVLDCVRPFLDAFGLDEHRDAGTFLTALDALIVDAGISEACVIHHMGHSGERSRGDSKFRDWPDAEWRLVRESDDPASARFLSAYGRDVEQPEAKLDFDHNTRKLTISGGSRKDTGHELALSAVLEFLAESDKHPSGREIEKAFKDSDFVRSEVKGAIALGIRTKAILTHPGPKRSTLHQIGPSAPVRRSAPGELENTSVRQCASAYRARRARALNDGEDLEQEAV